MSTYGKSLNKNKRYFYSVKKILQLKCYIFLQWKERFCVDYFIVLLFLVWWWPWRLQVGNRIIEKSITKLYGFVVWTIAFCKSFYIINLEYLLSDCRLTDVLSFNRAKKPNELTILQLLTFFSLGRQCKPWIYWINLKQYLVLISFSTTSIKKSCSTFQSKSSIILITLSKSTEKGV